MLPHVMRLNAAEVRDLYDELRAESADPGQPLWERFADLRARAGLQATLREVGVPSTALPRLAADAARQWTAGFNPVAVGESELLGLYESAY
jgi:alcohol dehydrogenase class IV